MPGTKPPIESHRGCRIVDGERNGSRALKAPDGRSKVAFGVDARKDGTEKLYVVKHAGEFCYVGRTGTSVPTRIQGGLNARYPYGWRRHSRVDLHVCFLGRTSDYRFGEGVEAELVHLIRLGTGQRPGKWPSDQNEIHFRHNKGLPDPERVKAARDIYRVLAKA